ncbi:MAG: hypothetical protein IT382_01825 [Deltaproteobacteria bacterium]|nr:hypothetical protein [Deltaproteobacteria bacterium]
MTDTIKPTHQKGRAARALVEAACDVLEASGQPDGKRLRAALSVLDELVGQLHALTQDADPVAAMLERAAARRRGAKR